MEKVVLAIEIMKGEEERVSRQLLKVLMDNNVDGFSTEVAGVCSMLNVSFVEMLEEKDVRKTLKTKIVKIQSQEMYKRMMVSTKMDGVLLNGFNYNGKTKKYLMELDFNEARTIFMVRYKMMPTKTNFPGRWAGIQCNICGFDDTDEHLFHCPGYQDLITADINYNMFWDDDVLEDTIRIKKAAGVMLQIVDRLNEVQGMIPKEVVSRT